MKQNLRGIFAAFAEPLFHGWANILDSYLSNSVFDGVTPLILLSSFFGLFTLPIIWAIDPPSLVSVNSGLLLFLVSITEVVYLYPYYWALRHADTSVVASLFSLGTLVIPFVAFPLLGERLTAWQYCGVGLLVISSVLLTLDTKRLILNRAFTLMTIVSIILAVQSVLLKYVYQLGIGWGTSIVWMALFQFFIAVALTCTAEQSSRAREVLKKARSAAPLIVTVELLTWLGTLGSTYALYAIPVSIAKGISRTQPIFVLVFSMIFARFHPELSRERMGLGGAKVVLFVLMVAGVVLIFK